MSFLDELIAEPWRFDLLATLRRLEREHPDKPRIGDQRRADAGFRDPFAESLSGIPGFDARGAGPGRAGRMRLVARFLGMFGPQGALPLTTTDESYRLAAASATTRFPRFVDIFQRRFLALFFRAWADARPIAQNDRPARIVSATYIGSVIGLGAPSFNDARHVSRFRQAGICGAHGAAREERVAACAVFSAGLVRRAASRSTNSSAPG